MPNSEVCTTQQAAEILGISVTSVQQLVETGEIEAWKTKGGHRRIPIAAVHSYRGGSGAATLPPGLAAAAPAPVFGQVLPRKAAPNDIAILVVEDNKMQRLVYQQQIQSWNLPATLKFCENGYQALVEIATHKPDILLTDIMMEGMDGFEVVATILEYPHLADMHIAILSSVGPDEIAERGGVPEGVVFFQKPVNYDELRGYLRACCAERARRVHA